MMLDRTDQAIKQIKEAEGIDRWAKDLAIQALRYMSVKAQREPVGRAGHIAHERAQKAQ